MEIYKVKTMYDSCVFCKTEYIDDESLIPIKPDYLYEIKKDGKCGLAVMVCQSCVNQLAKFGN
jgi:hypothetical protein